MMLLPLLPAICLVVASPVSQARIAQNDDLFEKSIQPFLSQYCYECHSELLKKGNLNLEAYQAAASVMQDREKWEKIFRKLSLGEMPPKPAPRPEKSEADAVLRWIEGEFDRADRLVKPDPGRVTARRLNRAEYNNTIRDLLGVNLRPADDFPQDDSGYGFDNIGDVLSLSPVLMEKYLTAAERIARTAVFGTGLLKPTLVRHQPTGRRIPTSTTPLLEYDGTGLSLPNALHVTHRFPVDGEYLFRVGLGGQRPSASEPIQISLWIDGRQVQTLELDGEVGASFSEDRQDFSGKRREFRAPVTAGDRWVALSILRIYEGLPASYAGPNPSKRQPPRLPEFQSRPGESAERAAQRRKAFEARLAEKAPANDVRISLVEIGGPYEQITDPSRASLERIYVCKHLDGNHQSGCARRIVANLARRAFRRPVTGDEINSLAGLISKAQKQGDSFEEGLVVMLQAMLVSPHFLFRVERTAVPGVDEARLITEHELASRLSYFIWSSMPDEELLRCADEQKLRQPRVLETQLRRMLKDSKSRAMVENFGGQWLELRKLESVKPDRQRFPEFEEYLLMSMRRETELFFDAIVREDGSILDFIDASYTFVNERLARFYKIPDVSGTEFRKVNLAGSTQRGGILTQASILTVSSYATRTSPVLRGKWILENMLNSPLPPPPPDVPNLDEAKAASTASLRQQMEQHRRNTTCASCHARMDPLGFGLENFDAIGAWRAKDGETDIDASGTLPDGRSFRGAQELKAILRADRDTFTESLTEKLLTYALGRGLERYDRPTVRMIARRVAASDYRFSALVLEIVNSVPFQMRRGDSKP